MENRLPIFGYEEKIVRAVRDHQVVIVAAETGAGKSTEVPCMLLKAGLAPQGMIGVTEPRRVAAMSLAEYVAENYSCKLGQEIGFQIGGERALSHTTKVKYMTEGILLREMHGNSDLRGKGNHPGYDIIIVDEAHERGVNQDLILALLKQVMVRRPDLKIVIMSATIDVHRFAEHFGCPQEAVIEVPGRVYDVDVRWAEETPWDMTNACSEKIVEILLGTEAGDILVFMPDEKSIKKVCELVEQKCPTGIKMLPLYGNQAPEDQRDALKKRPERRVIVATNIAETSLTVDGVVHVVDSGLIKAMRYVNATMSALEVTEHSKAGCEQRKGRAGRTRAGICHRLFSRDDWEERDGFTKPEILRMSLDQVLLHLRVLGYTMDQILNLDFMDSPGKERWQEAEALLKLLNALDQDSSVTDDGRLMERFAAAPMIARMLITAQQYKCTDEVAIIAAGFVSRPVFVRPKGKETQAERVHLRFRDDTSDAFTLLKVWDAWCVACQSEDNPYKWARDNFLSSRALRDIGRNRDQMIATLEKQGVDVTSSDDKIAIRKAVASGLIVNLCMSSGGKSYSWQKRHDVFIHPGSSLFGALPQTMVCTEVVETTKVFARNCTAIEKSWLDELIPEHALEVNWLMIHQSIFEDKKACLIEQKCWQGVTISSKELEEIPVAAMPWLVRELYTEMQSYSRSFHPQSYSNRMVRNEVCRLLTPESTNSWSIPEEIIRMVETAAQTFIADRIKGVRTLEKLWLTDLAFSSEDLLPDDQVGQELKAKINAKLQQLEQERREHKQRELQRQQEALEQQRKLEAQLEPLRREAAELLESLSGLVETHEVINLKLEVQRVATADALHWTYADSMRKRLSGSKFIAQRLIREQRQEFGLSDMIWQTVLEQFPTCPLCGNEWAESGNMLLRCNHGHDLGRALPLNENYLSDALGRFVTNNGYEVATIRADQSGVWLRFVAPRNSAWYQTKFKQVTYAASVVILPEELAGEREEILNELRELVEAREHLERVVAEIKKFEERVGMGKVRKLKFKDEGGKAVARVSGTKYQSVYQENYPQDGETWFCEIGDSTGLNVVTVYPLMKAGSISSEADLEEIRDLLREMYPGIPEELLN
ncbi:MAG: oligonucleotide/oligosaccharide-binding fold domain-containing protein [Patescibacteria group bacterium]